MKTHENDLGAVDAYIASTAQTIAQKWITDIRNQVTELIPDVIQKVSWGMITFVMNGNFLHVGAFSGHIGLYSGAEATAWFTQRYPSFATSKGGIRIPYDQPLPLEEIRVLIQYLGSSRHD
ncbi:iron chaperone [Parasphaerochaeta coccoides]|uniref:YdhG-like domain-containing protein n=1 Tax=Parasphaerochaeta coccoides (strain ATCC BAA-1237 / DSM 17374 / SPN1) TaxID=760011 RepID=F4GIW1_PARC1|nr:DUF1801 domain-containing protein [Parasphaerochaeta coccoides]AEC02729.1 Domain of unknown function DUF1801 [Parasphaerochaeta coccoides DSM 17374]